MKKLGVLFIIANLWSVSLHPLPAGAQTFPVQMDNLAQPRIDLRSLNYNGVIDVVSGNAWTSGSSINGAPTSTFTSTASSFSPAQLNLKAPENWKQYGFTVAAQLDPANQPAVGTVFTLVDTLGNVNSLLFAVLRDSNGRWWMGKRRDAQPGSSSFAWYAQKTWDPFSPCVPAGSCITDTLYVSFLTNGQVQLDEVATLKATTNSPTADSYDWESGLLNFGLPQQGYNVGSFDGAQDPVAPLQTVPIGGIELTTLAASQFGSGNILNQTTYPAMALDRFAVWSNPTSTPGYGTLNSQYVVGLNATSTNGIMEDQAQINPMLLPQTNWLPCSSGQFEEPVGTGDALSVQYDPANLPTPCNVPSAPVTPLPVFSNNSLQAYWGAPESPGTAPAGTTPSITGYQANAVDFLDDTLSCTAPSSGGSCVLGTPISGRNYRISITAQGMGGKSGTVKGVSPAAVTDFTPAGLVPYPPQSLIANPQPTVQAAVISWRPSAVPNGGGPVSSYTLVYEAGASGATVPNAISPYTITGLPAGSSVTVQVSANNSTGTSVPAVASFAMENVPAGAPSNLLVTQQPNALNISWSPPTSSGSGPVRYYIATLIPTLPSGTPITQNPVNGLSTSFSGLNPYVGYVVSISAFTIEQGPAASSSVSYPQAVSNPWTFCANNNSTCSPPSGSVVRFGDTTSQRFYYATTSAGSFQCGSANFNGTPAGATNLSCYYAPATVMPSTIGGFSFCAGAGGTCSYPGGGTVAYGGGGRFVYAAAKGTSVSCSVGSFPPFNPSLPSGTPISCSYQATPLVPGLAWCADGEGGVCDTTLDGVTGPGYIGYGRYNHLAYIPVGAGAVVNCSSSSFYSYSPYPGLQNSCFYLPVTAVPVAPASSSFCALNGGTCVLPTSNNAVSRGASGYYTMIDVQNPALFTCSASNFPYDAALGMAEACYYTPNAGQSTTTPPGATLCSAENGICSFNQTGYLIFGSTSFNGTSAYVTIPNSGSVSCTSSSFGAEPGPGVRSCFGAQFGADQGHTTDWYYSESQPPLPAGFYFCAALNGSCFGNVSRSYVYVLGAQDYFYVWSEYGNASTPCTTALFGGVPKPGVVNYCGIAFSTSHSGPGVPYGYASCASEGGTCAVASGQQVWAMFGAQSRYVLKRLTGSFTCSSATFGNDPEPGNDSCWYMATEPQ